MDSAFWRGLYLAPPVATVCGLRLEPLSLHHIALLTLLDHPLVGQGPEFTDVSLTQAACVCSTRWPGGCARFFPELDMQWALNARLALNFDADLETFRAYWNAFWMLPKVAHFSGVPSGAPGPYLQAVFLLTTFHGMTEEVVWNMPLPRVFSYRAIIDEASGAWIRRPELEALVVEASAANG